MPPPQRITLHAITTAVAILFFAATPRAFAGDSLKEIQKRGVVRCGINTGLTGFSVPSFAGGSGSSGNNATGFDADYCKALAAAVFGDPTKVLYVALNVTDRFSALRDGTIDVLIRNTTNTLNRDTTEGADFGPTTFHDGQGFLSDAPGPVTDATLAEFLTTRTVCVIDGTTTQGNLHDYFILHGLPTSNIVVVSTNADLIDAYAASACAVMTGDATALAASRPAVLPARPGSIVYAARISQEPLAPAVSDKTGGKDDGRWLAVVRWVVYATFFAEDHGLTGRCGAHCLGAGPDATLPEVQRFLGGGSPTLGAQLGLPNDWAVRVVEAVGNYGQIYDANLVGAGTPDISRAGTANQLPKDGGLLFYPPFR